MPPDSNDDHTPSRQAQMTAPAPLSNDELKTVTLALRNASNLCEVVDYIGELTLLEASCLGKCLVLVTEWLSKIEMLAGWRGELEVNLELFAADVELVLEACRERGKLSFEKYVAWFAQSGFQAMPRYKGRFRRLFKALEKLRNYTRMVYLEIPDPTPSPSPAPALVVQPVPEEQSTTEATPEVVENAASWSDADVPAAASIAETSTERDRATTAASPQNESEDLAQSSNNLERFYLPQMDKETGWVPWPASEFSEAELQSLHDAARLWSRACDLVDSNQCAAAATPAAAAVDAVRPIYNQATLAGRQATAFFFVSTLVYYAVTVEDVERQDLHSSLWRESTAVVREALQHDPYDATLLNCLATLLSDAPKCLRTEEVAAEAANLLRKLLGVAKARGGKLANYLDPTALRDRLAEALLLLGASRFSARPEEAVDAWEEGVRHVRVLLQSEPSGPVCVNAYWDLSELCLCLAKAYSDQGEDKEALSKAREGLQSWQRYQSATTDNQALFSTGKDLCALCRRVLPREEKRLVKLVNIRKIQAKTRKQARQMATEEQKAELAAAVAELADLRELQRALREGLL